MKEISIVYLAGAINKCSDEEAKDWREEAKKILPLAVHVLDPMSRDYRGVEIENASSIVEGDKADILKATAIIVKASKPSWGTAMEIMFAYQNKKPLYAFDAGPRPSPWLVYHCTICDSLQTACAKATRETTLP
jgi:nucleoside 2-deoxyribosyltransferase